MNIIDRRSMLEAMVGLTIVAGAAGMAATSASALPTTPIGAAPKSATVDRDGPAGGSHDRPSAENVRWFFMRRRRYVRRRRFGFY